jgi:hypothetical protein
MNRFLWLLALILLVSCEKENLDTEALGKNADIVGVWIEEQPVDFTSNDYTLMVSSDELDPGSYGFIIGEDGSYVERKNAGWCGTPPIFYDNFEGTWEALSDSLLSVTVGFWGGTMSYQIRIVSLDEEQLKIRYLYADNIADSK